MRLVLSIRDHLLPIAVCVHVYVGGGGMTTLIGVEYECHKNIGM